MTDKNNFAAPWYRPELRATRDRIGTLWGNLNDVNGDVTLTDEFLSLSAIERADILKDILAIVTEAYNAAVLDLRSAHVAIGQTP